MSSFQPFKVTAKKGLTLSLMSLQRTIKKMPKYKFAILAGTCLLNHLEVSSWKIKSCCNNNMDEQSIFHFHIAWTQDKVKGENLNKLPKFKSIIEY